MIIKGMEILDFTLKKYEKLCEAIVSSEYSPMKMETYFELQRPVGSITLRHDVDRMPENALKMAEIENRYNIKSTYYFRTRPDVFIPSLIKKIADLGHEIGYHYEVLDTADGNFEKAIKIFEEDLSRFREICNVKTICMHGNPLSKWTNKDLWGEYNFEDFGIIGEPYLSIDYTLVTYFTDTGRAWNESRYSVKDVIDSKTNQAAGRIKNTDHLIEIIKEGNFEQICILVHPNRWNDNRLEWLKELIGQNVKNVGKYGIIWYKKVIQ